MRESKLELWAVQGTSTENLVRLCEYYLMNYVRRHLELAAAVSRLKEDNRTYFHGAVGIREDGVLVAASNGCPKFPTPEHHCEFRITRKLGTNGIIFLVRTLSDGSWGDSTPCVDCKLRMKRRKVEKCYFSDPSMPYLYNVYYPVNDKYCWAQRPTLTG